MGESSFALWQLRPAEVTQARAVGLWLTKAKRKKLALS